MYGKRPEFKPDAKLTLGNVPRKTSPKVKHQVRRSLGKIMGACILGLIYSFCSVYSPDTRKQLDLLIYLYDKGILSEGEIEQLDTSKITDMSRLFQGMTEFNVNIGGWCISNVVSIQAMFFRAKKFNQNLNKWDTSNVLYMLYAFKEAVSFNGDISRWKTTKTINMEMMFDGATNFNCDIGNWDMRRVRGTRFMFRNAVSFNRDLNGWLVRYLRDIYGMFFGALSFDEKNIDMWDLSGIKFQRKINRKEHLTKKELYRKRVVGHRFIHNSGWQNVYVLLDMSNLIETPVSIKLDEIRRDRWKGGNKQSRKNKRRARERRRRKYRQSNLD